MWWRVHPVHIKQEEGIANGAHWGIDGDESAARERCMAPMSASAHACMCGGAPGRWMGSSQAQRTAERCVCLANTHGL